VWSLLKDKEKALEAHTYEHAKMKQEMMQVRVRRERMNE